jgi:hypothetical protein
MYLNTAQQLFIDQKLSVLIEDEPPKVMEPEADEEFESPLEDK